MVAKVVALMGILYSRKSAGVHQPGLRLRRVRDVRVVRLCDAVLDAVADLQAVGRLGHLLALRSRLW